MNKQGYTRRDFIKGASALVLPSFAGRELLAQTATVERPDWDTFRTTSNYASPVYAMAIMKDNTDRKRVWPLSRTAVF